MAVDVDGGVGPRAGLGLGDGIFSETCPLRTVQVRTVPVSAVPARWSAVLTNLESAKRETFLVIIETSVSPAGEIAAFK